MKELKIAVLLTITLLLTSCASGYKMINPKNLNYNSNSTNKDVTLNYKYDLLDKKYAKKETKREVKVVAIKITNHSENDLIFGKDIRLTYENGKELYILEKEKTFNSVKQNTIPYLFYLLLTPMTLNKTTINGNGIETSSTPIGFAVGPGLAAGNMIAAGSANKKLKNDLLNYDILGANIKKGETIYGLIGIKSDNYDSIKIKVE